MSQTEELLQQAQDIARRAFEQPTDEAVLAIFQRICYERDLVTDEVCGAILH